MSRAVRLNALEHALVGQQWETTYELAPVGADSWIWDTSIWDTSTRWAY